MKKRQTTKVIMVYEAGVTGVFRSWKQVRRCFAGWAKDDFPGAKTRFEWSRTSANQRVLRCVVSI